MKFRVFYLFYLLPFLFFSQTVITGRVYDISNGQAIPFAIIKLRGTSVGTNSDFDGNYRIETRIKADSIQIGYTGYVSKSFAIKNGQTQVINVGLEVFSLEEVLIKPGENPAHRIIRKVVAHKENNNKKRLKAYEYEVYNKIEFDLNNIPKSFKDKKSMKPVKFIFNNIDSSNTNGEKPFLPIFMIESLSNLYWRDDPEMKREVIMASKVTGFENNSISQIMGDMYQNINIYDNNIMVFGKQFVSPVSESAIGYYKFYLEDSSFIGNTRCYHIRFKPRRKMELLFSGNMWIADTTFGLRRLEMTVPKDANVNFIRGANVIQEFAYVDSSWLVSKDRIIIDFAIKEDGTGIYGRKTTSYKNIITNRPRDKEFFSGGVNVVLNDGATKKNEAFWEEHRHDSLSSNEKKIIRMIDTLQKLPIYRTWVDIFTLIVSGYENFGNFDLGPVANLFSYNNLEGARFRLGGRTSKFFSKWYQLSGYVAYGLNDQEYKYGLGFRTFLNKGSTRQMIGINYKSDLEILGQSQNGFSQDNFLSSLLRITPLNSLTRIDETMLWHEKDWKYGISTRATFVNRKLSPAQGITYNYIDENNRLSVYPYLRTSEFRFLFRFAYDEKFIEGAFNRVSLGTKYPILQMNFVTSIPNLYEGLFSYKKFVLKIEDRLRIHPLLGFSDISIEGGKFWGSAPYPLLELHGGNSTYIYDKMAYNTMNFCEFVSDQYASFWIDHHFEGLFFNKIPLLRRLKWREVVTYKFLIGSISEQNKNEVLFPKTLYDLSSGPYQEVSAGIENIAKIFRVDAFWRLSYQGVHNAADWGIKGGFRLSF